MSDLVKRLREGVYAVGLDEYEQNVALREEAADRIAELEAALAEISSGIQYTEHGLRGIARRALADIKQGNAR